MQNRKLIGITLSEATSLAIIRRKLYGAPSRGTQYGPGQNHVSMPDSWDEEGPVPIGWTGFPGTMLVSDSYEIDLPADLIKILIDKADLVTAEEASSISVAFSLTVEPPDIDTPMATQSEDEIRAPSEKRRSARK